MLLLPALAAAALTPAQTSDIDCVALLGVVAYEQKRGGWADVPPLEKDGARFAEVVGVATVKAGRTREQVRDLILAEVARLQKAGAPPRASIDRCVARMKVAAPAPPPPTPVRCAAIMASAADDARARDGMSNGVKDVATLAAVLAYRARTEGAANGQSEAQVNDAIAAARKALGPLEDIPYDDLEACTEMAGAQ